MAEDVPVFGDIAESIRKRPALWAVGGALAVGLGVYAMTRRPAPEPVQTEPVPDAGRDVSDALEGLTGTISGQQQAILTAIAQLGETLSAGQQAAMEAQQAAMETQLEAITRLQETFLEAQEEQAARQAELWAQFQERQAQLQESILQRFAESQASLSQRLADVLDALREDRYVSPAPTPSPSPTPSFIQPPYGPELGYGLTWEPGEGPKPPTIQEIMRDPKLLAQEIARTEIVIQNRLRAGLPIEDQLRRLETLYNIRASK